MPRRWQRMQGPVLQVILSFSFQNLQKNFIFPKLIKSAAVSKNTSILVAGEGAGSKISDAEEKGVEIWTEAQFLSKFSSGSTESEAGLEPIPAKKSSKKKAEKKVEAKEEETEKGSGSSSSFDGKSIVFTGTMKMVRSHAKKLAEDAGARVLS